MTIRLTLAVCIASLGATIPAQESSPAGGDDVMVRQVPFPPATREREHYIGNRPPLTASPLIKLPIGRIKVKGWLLTQLRLMSEGFVGRLPELSEYCRPDSGWRKPEERGWEELPYWLRGYGDLGCVLQNEKIIAAAKEWLDAAIASQQEDGYFGPHRNKANRDVWPNMIMLYALRSRQEATGDERIIPMMTRYFGYRHALPPEELYPWPWGEGEYRWEWWQHVRAVEELDSVYWLYNRTGEDWLLELAERIHHRGANWTNHIASWHGVNITMGFREPGVYYQQAKDPRLLDAVAANYKTVYDLYGQVPGGMFGADENCREGRIGPRQAAETCSMVEIMQSFESLLKITGDPDWADKCEEVAFNSLPAAMTPDWKGLHYLTAPNMVQLDRRSKAPGLENGGNMLAYDPARYRCCQHDVSMGWPYYAEHLWMATGDGGLAAVLYAASEVQAKVGPGVETTITETTDYPFDETVSLHIATPRGTRFPLYLRIPRWCQDATLSINAKACPLPKSDVKGAHYVAIDRTWADGDEVVLRLPMRVQVKTWPANKYCVSVSRGPLTYSLKIGEKWMPYGEDDRWPKYEVFPATPWNYGLLLDESDAASSFTVRKKPGPLAQQPFDQDGAPIELIAKGRRIPAWQLDRTGLVGPLQNSAAKVDSGDAEQITLIPMGCARLRISAFPTVSSGPEAHPWTPPPVIPHEASYEHDDIAALSDGVRPKSSDDHDIPRFTWWPHKGTTEWVTYKFDTPQRIAETHVYWFDDTGRGYCRVPAAWRVLWKENEAWRPVTGVTGGGTEIDAYNAMTFDPVVSTELKIEVTLQDGFSGGILEWIVGRRGPL